MSARAAILLLASLALAAPSLGSSPKQADAPLPTGLPASAIASDVVVGDRPQIEARLLVSSGPDRSVGVLLDLAEGWHVYWRNPGDTGLAPRIEIEAPGQDVGAIEWPAPSIYEEADGLFTTFGYSKRVLLAMPLRARGDASAGPPRDAVVRADAHALICKTECVPARFSLSTPLAPRLSDEDQARIDRFFAEAATARPLAIDELGFTAHARWRSAASTDDTPRTLALEVRTCPADRPACDAAVSKSKALPFLPFEDSPYEFTEHRVVTADASPGAARIEMQAARIEEGDDRLRGLVLVEDAHGRVLHVAVDVPIEATDAQQAVPVASQASAAPPAPPMTFAAWVRVFFLALLGGLILNGMPCVLPVLAIKVVAIADLAEKSRNHVRVQGLAYTGGVLASMGALAGVVIFLRRAGHSVGWGFQFQEPLFVAAISALLVAFALNLFGVFEIDFGQGRLAQVGQSGSDTRRSVFEGLLAVILATPCTAPFLGTAVGFAFAASDWTIATIFLAIGLGLASPFLVVSFWPGFARFIPRSGPWMLKLRAGLGFSLLATVVWLLWIIGQSGGLDDVIGLVATLLLLSFLLWAFGQAQPLRSRTLGHATTIAIAGVAFAGFNLIGFQSASNADAIDPQAPATDVALEVDAAGWAPYSEAAVAAALDEGRPAFVVFTADWCITCKVNEKTVLERATIRAALAESGHALFKADWTRRDERIRAKLAEFGRAGVPLYLVYSPDAPDQPHVLSELLSQQEVRSALAATRGSGRG